MATIATNILAISAAKTDLAENLTTKGVTSADTEALAALVGKVLDVPTGYTGYAPPSDWIDIDTITDGNINLLVSDGSMATYAFKCSTSTGTYHVDWGDGTSADFASAATAQHTYAVGTGQACSRGYTTFKIVISSNTGNLTAFAIARHSLAARVQCYGILSAVIAATHLTTLASAFYVDSSAPYYNNALYCRVLERVKLVGTFTVLLFVQSMFYACYLLQSVDVSGMVAVTTATSMFQGCSSLQSIDVSGMIAVTTATSMFNGCASLQSVDVSGMVAVTTATSMFQGCSSLQSVDVSGMVAVTTATSMFNTCVSLTTITATTFARDAALVTFLTAFSNCEQLTEINFPVSKMTVLTAAGTSGQLNKLATITMHASSTLNGTNPTMDLQHNTLSAAQLDTIFTALPTVAKTINISGCTGAATCTRSIATNKTWTVTG